MILMKMLKEERGNTKSERKKWKKRLVGFRANNVLMAYKSFANFVQYERTIFIFMLYTVHIQYMIVKKGEKSFRFANC